MSFDYIIDEEEAMVVAFHIIDREVCMTILVEGTVQLRH